MPIEAIETEVDLSPNKADVGEKRPTPKGVEDGTIEVEVVDDTPVQDRGRAARKPGTKTAVPEDDEIEKYGKETQDRIRQMKWEFHEERRSKEQWQREHGAAIDFAKKVHEENKRLRDMVTKGHKTLVDSQQSSGENEIKALQRSLQSALESGDTQSAADLNTKIASAAARVEATRHIQPIEFDDADPDRFTKQPAQQSQQRQPVRLSERMQEWVEENPWFNQDKRMTAYAFGIHEELLAARVPPESPKYFSELNREMQERFPEYYDDEAEKPARQQARRETPRRTAATAVARTPAGRVNGKSKVTLSTSQAAFARKLGVTNEQYAAEMIRLQESDNAQ